MFTLHQYSFAQLQSCYGSQAFALFLSKNFLWMAGTKLLLISKDSVSEMSGRSVTLLLMINHNH